MKKNTFINEKEYKGRLRLDTIVENCKKDLITKDFERKKGSLIYIKRFILWKLKYFFSFNKILQLITWKSSWMIIHHKNYTLSKATLSLM